MRPDARRLATTTVSIAVVSVSLCAPAASAAGRSAGKWLVDLGRDYAASEDAAGTNADATIVLSFMQAAARLEPALAESYLWQYDMLRALGRPDEAHAALRAYVERAPENVSAHMLWVQLSLDQLQTADKRAELCRDYLTRADLPAEVASDLHRRLAEFHYNRAETEAGDQQAAKALERFELNLAASRLRYEYHRSIVDSGERAAVLLDQIAANPADGMAIWQLAKLLDSAGLHAEAQFWYDQAIKMFHLADSRFEPPPELLLDQARSYANAGQRDKAAELCRQALAAQLQQAEVTDEQVEKWLASARRPDTRPAKDAPDATTQRAIQAKLESFDRAVLDFPFNPSKYLQMTAELPGRVLRLGEPWCCVLAIKNLGAFPITLGEGLMVSPTAIVSAIAVGDRERRVLHYMPVALNQRPVLAPGESVQTEQTLDLGPVGEAMACTPQVTHQIVLSVLLAPSQDEEGQWRSRLIEFKPTIIRVTREAFEATPENVAKQLAQATSGTEAERAEAAMMLASLLAEAQRLQDGRLEYQARPIEAQVIHDALMARLSDASPIVRARLLDALRWVRLDSRMVGKLAAILSDEHWLVRMTAVQLLSRHQRERFSKVVARIAQTDPDSLVRQLAWALRDKWTPATTTPAEETGRRQEPSSRYQRPPRPRSAQRSPR